MITHRIHRWAHVQPERRAIVCNDAVTSYREWSNTLAAMRDALAAEQLPSGATVGVCVENLFDAWSIVLALRGLGLTTIALQSLDALAMLGLADLAAVVVTRPEAEARGLDVARVPVRIVVLSEAALRGATAAARPNEAAPFGDHLVYTSGTTGAYKKLRLDGATEDARNDVRGAFFGFRNDTVCHGTCLGLWTAMGAKHPPTVWHAGGCVVFDQRRDWARHFFRQPLTHASLIPSLVPELAACPDPGGRPGPGFELIVAAGFLPLAGVEAIHARFGTRVNNVYGSTELTLPPLRSTSDSLADFHWLVPTPGRGVEIVDESGRLCTSGQEGQLRVRLDDLDCHGYLDDPAATARVFRAGCFYPGDLAVRRDDGRIRILGRVGDVITVVDQKIAAAPLELALQAELGVREVCMFSGMAPDGTEELVIAIEADAAPPRDRLQAVQARWPTFARVYFAVLPAFPRTSAGTGKTQRAVLRSRVLARLRAASAPRRSNTE